MATSDKAISEVLSDLNGSDDYDALWGIFVSYIQSLGANLISYHHIPPAFSSDKDKVTVRAHGFDQDWVDTYAEQKFYRIDPITQLAAQSLNPFKWSEIEKLVTLTAEQEKFLVILKSWLKGDGMAIPAFGPSGRNGYFGIGHSETIKNWTEETERFFYWVCQAYHHRMCELRLKALDHDFVLTEREKKVLGAMAQGLSDEMICGVINARLESVQGTIRKIMAKMNVSDRASLLLRATACGIIER